MEAQETPPSLGDPPSEPPPADWLEPVEDIDEDIEEEENVGDQGLNLGDPEKADTGTDVLKRTHHDGLQSKTPTELDDLWVDWPTLGKGWKRKEVYRNSGTRSDTYYMSPDGVRMRSKVEIASYFPHIDLRSFDFKRGLFLNKKQSKQKRSVNNSEDEIVSGQITPPESSSIPTILPQTPQRPNLNPNSGPSRPSSDFGSPPHLTPISPLKQQSTQSPSLDSGDLNPTTTTHTPTLTPPSKLARNALIPKSWLHPSVRPVSPGRKGKKKKKKKKKKRSASPNGRVSPIFPSPPVTQRVMDPKMVLTPNKQPPEPRSVMRNCTRCTGAFSSLRNEEFCPACSTLKKISIPSQNIVFKKIAHGKWVLASPDELSPENKAKSTEHGKNIKSLKSQRLLEIKSKKIIDSEDKPSEVSPKGCKKRDKRMCFKCVACCRTSDCGKCDNCMDKPKYGGCNKKRQKCRLRQCLERGILYKSKTYNIEAYKPTKHFGKEYKPTKHYAKEYKPTKPCMKEYTPTRPRSTRPHKRPAWEEDYTYPDELKKRRRQRGSEDEEEGDKDHEDYAKFELEQDQNDVTIYEHASGAVNTQESLHAFPLIFQNGQLQIDSCLLQTDGTQASIVLYMAPPAGGAVGLSIDAQTVSRDIGAPVEEDPLEEEEESPPITFGIPRLADGSEPLEGSGEPELLHLLGALHRTILPAHWMAVLAKGPSLQLLQCSRRSAMANTLLQIEPGFGFSLSVAGLLLPSSHPLYERHPLHLATVSTVVELLLDMESLAVCRGYPWDSELAAVAVLYGRSAGCHLLVDPEEEGEHCDKCHPPLSD